MSINPALIDHVLPIHDGYPDVLAAEDTRDAMMMAAAEAGITIVEFPKHFWIEPKDWPDAARDAKVKRLRPIDFVDRFTNQSPTHECTCHSLRTGAEAARNRQRRIVVGPPVAGQRLETSAKSNSVWLSPLSIYAEANPRQWGGASCRQVLQIAGRRGFLPEPIQPREYNFTHTLHGTTGKGGINQSRGKWVRLSEFPEGFEETSKHFKPVECVFPEIWEQMVCLQLHGFIVNVGRDGHAVPLCEWIPGDDVSAYIDSYDVIRYDSISRMKRSVGGASAILTMTEWVPAIAI